MWYRLIVCNEWGKVGFKIYQSRKVGDKSENVRCPVWNATYSWYSCSACSILFRPRKLSTTILALDASALRQSSSIGVITVLKPYTPIPRTEHKLLYFKCLPPRISKVWATIPIIKRDIRVFRRPTTSSRDRTSRCKFVHL